MTEISLHDFHRELNCIYDEERYSVRDNGAIFRHPRTGKRQRKAVPVRATRMLLLLSDGRLLLEKRPSTGIWGGLWSFPETSIDEDAASICMARFGFGVDTVEALPLLKHAFTHFTLNIHPVQCQVRTGNRAADGAATAWMTPEHAMKEAVPVPVKKLLAGLKTVPGIPPARP